MSLFLRLIEVEDKATALKVAVRGGGSFCYTTDPADFSQVPGSPFAYWVSDNVRKIFVREQSFRDKYFCVRGAYTTDDFKYYRLTWEIDPSAVARSRSDTFEKSSVPLAKGGAFARFYADIHLAMIWKNDGEEAKAYLASYREHKGWGSDWSACTVLTFDLV